MQAAPEHVRAPKRARAKHGTTILAKLVAGSSLENIAEAENLTPKRVEKLLREELRRRWVAPAQDYARLQIARLESMSAKLSTKAEKGDLPTIDRLLRILDRLDKYHGFSKLTPTASADYSQTHDRLMAKLGLEAAKFLPPPSEAS